MTDRRAFDKSGERKEDVPAVAPSPPTSAEPPKTEPPRSLPPADLATLVLSLGSSAIMYLGESGDGKQPERNLPMAKHVIDLLTVLEDKTKGNLSGDEERLLSQAVTDLRLRFVEVARTK